MKILTGELRGRTLAFQPHPDLRPTADKVRQAIFNALAGVVEGRAVLDIFAGTGAMGFEALSGGATRAVFVERDAARAKRIQQNLDALDLDGRADVKRQDALAALEGLGVSGETFGLFFIDPPYGGEDALAALAASAQLAEPGAIAVLECGKREDVPEEAAGFRLLKEKKYGGTRVAFYGYPQR